MSAYDVIVIGAGHNGLTAAATLAQAGRKVLVLERRDVVGGLAAAEEFHDGHVSAGILQDTGGVRPHVVEGLGLESHGLTWTSSRPDVLLVNEKESLLLAGDVPRAATEIGRRSPQDAGRYPEFRARIDALSEVLCAFLDEPPANLVDVESIGLVELLKRGLRIRRLGREHMMELLRLPPMCVADWLGEWFQDELLKAGLCVPAVAGTFSGPWSPGSNANLLFHEAAAGRAVMGGGPALVAALRAALQAAGGEVRTGAGVQRILLAQHAVTGVRLADGQELSAPVVLATCHPQLVFLDLLAPGSTSFRLRTRLENLRTRGTTAQVRFAVSDPPIWSSAGTTTEFVRVVRDVDTVERAFDAAKYRRLPEQPVLEVHVPPTGRTVSVLVHFAPYDLQPGWDDAHRQELLERVEGTLETLAPGFSSSVVHRDLRTPVDLEAELGLVGGNLHHGEHALDQRLVRPVPECVGGATPIAGLYLGGAGSHPGGGLTCGPGARGAATILART